jgi:hypothetical protein
VRHPIRAAAVLVGLAALAALPHTGQAQDGSVSDAAVTMPVLRSSDVQDRTTAAPVKPQTGKKQKQATRKSAKEARAKVDTSNALVPRSTFEDRTAHYFDPLSLTLAPDSRIDPISSEYSQVTNSIVAADKGQVAVTPDDPTTRQISSASIENMGQGRNVTVMVPLFQILNSLSPGPAPQ